MNSEIVSYLKNDHMFVCIVEKKHDHIFPFILEKKMDEWPVEEKEVMKILVEVATSKREAEIVRKCSIWISC